MNKVIVGAVLAVGVGVGGLAVAAPAMAQGPTVDCSGGCVNRAAIAADPPTGAPWTDFFANGPWEPIFAADPWGQAFDATDGVPGDGEGAWEKVFPPAPSG